ncbi:MAG TPA: hypothetical protein ACFCUY_08625 [Xenococcaceae cyanobacterium]
MIKYLVSFIIAVVGLIASWTMGNTAIADTIEIENNLAKPVTTSKVTATAQDNSVRESGSGSNLVNLNLNSPWLESNNSATTIFEHLGCSCAACLQNTVS